MRNSSWWEVFKTVFRGFIFIPAWNFKSNRCYCDREKKNYGSSIHVRKTYIKMLPPSFCCRNAVVYAPLPALICTCGPKYGVLVFFYSVKISRRDQCLNPPACSRGMRRLSSSGNSALSSRWHSPSFGRSGAAGVSRGSAAVACARFAWQLHKKPESCLRADRQTVHLCVRTCKTSGRTGHLCEWEGKKKLAASAAFRGGNRCFCSSAESLTPIRLSHQHSSVTILDCWAKN